LFASACRRLVVANCTSATDLLCYCHGASMAQGGAFAIRRGVSALAAAATATACPEPSESSGKCWGSPMKLLVSAGEPG
jgi:hypothetical protein